MGFNIFKLSSEQEKAVDITKNIAVSAGAGSGKTRVLTSRYIRLLDSGFQIEEIAAITFTEKAALEMKQRIRKSIIGNINSSNNEERERWMEKLDRLGRANISTIHGFCSNIIKENAAYLALDFNYSIISDLDKSIILKEAMESAKNTFFNKAEYSEVLNKLSKAYGEKYLNSAFLREINQAREKILENGLELKELIEASGEGTIEKLIYEITREINEIYQTYKQGKELLDYDDLESMTLKVLEVPELRERYRNRYKTLLVDEFQDTNEIQRKIIYYISADNNGNLLPSKLFIVGDFKQSIYGFRGTDYRLFKKVSEDIGEEGQAPLTTCYRSKNEIIQGINFIFSKLIEDYEPLKCPKEMSAEEKRIKVITSTKSKEKNVSLISDVKSLLQGKTSSFNNVGEAFKALENSADSIPKPKENKNAISVMKAIGLLRDKEIQFKDMCILVRSKSVIPDIEDELKRRNVPYCIIGGRGFYQKEEIDEILNLYKVIIKGFEAEFAYEDNINFIKALRGPLFEVPDRLILKISIERQESSRKNLYESMDFVIDAMEDGEDRQRLDFVYKTLGRLNMLKDRLSVVQLLNSIIEDCRVYEVMLSRDNGVQKFRNVEKLIHEARKFDKEELFTLEQFVDYIEELNENSTDDSEAALDTEDSEAIKIMTIHQSKGLEFKGVIVPKIQGDLLWVSKTQKSDLVYDDGRILLSKNIETGEDCEEHRRYYIERFSSEIDEYIRLLYVAMTRAEDYVILTGEDDEKDPGEINCEEDKIKELNSFLKQIKYAIKVKAADCSLIDFIDYEDLDDLDIVENDYKAEEVKTQETEKRIKYKFEAKPNALVGATRYMKYDKCPRKFYIENVLKVSGSDYTDTEFSKEIETVEGDINGAALGTAVHSILEGLNTNEAAGEDDVIKKVIESQGLENTNDFKLKLKGYIENYKTLEKAQKFNGAPIWHLNELEYNLVPNDDRRLSIIGFMDRTEVFEEDGILTAVITDYKTNKITSRIKLKELTDGYEMQLQIYGKAAKELLRIDGKSIDNVILQLYFLDITEKVEIPYDEEKVMVYFNSADKIFARNLTSSSSSEFPKKQGIQCERCQYRDIC